MTLLNVSTQGLTLQFLWLDRSYCMFLLHPSHYFYKYILFVPLSVMARTGQVRADYITLSKTDSFGRGSYSIKANGGYVYIHS